METLAFANKPTALKDFNAIKISLASPEKIRSWSLRRGHEARDDQLPHVQAGAGRALLREDLRPDHRLGMPLRQVQADEAPRRGLRQVRRRGHASPRSAASGWATSSWPSPVSHVWFFKGLPSRIGHLLDISLRDLERILYFESYVVIDPGETDLKEKELLSEERYRDAARPSYGDVFVARMGAEAIKELLQRVDVEMLAEELRMIMKTETSQIKRQKAAKRLKVCDAFRRSGHRPDWMILDVIPVIPPELRPLVPLDGGRFATSDLNDLYRRVINRNNRLKKLLELRAPEVIVRNEKRMLQEAVDALFDNGRRGRVLKGSNNRPAEVALRHAQGQAGPLPAEPARQARRLLGPLGHRRRTGAQAPPVRACRRRWPSSSSSRSSTTASRRRASPRRSRRPRSSSSRGVTEVWDALEEVIRDHPVLLNRAPTLHRLGIQAFQPVLVEGKAIKIHPLVCPAFNADFDGDQMAVHVPLSPKAQIEAELLMLSSNNILSPASGRPLAVPSQDLVLGSYYLTKSRSNTKGEGRIFADFDEVLLAYERATSRRTRRSACATRASTST